MAISLKALRFAKSDAFAVLAILVFGAFLSFHLSDNPVIRHDEVLNLAGAQSLVEHGAYALETAEGLQWFDVAITTGPSTQLPIALVFKLWGVSLLYARLVNLMFFLASLYMMWKVTAKTYNPQVAFLSLLIFALVAPRGLPILLSRIVMGEVPALFYFLGGVSLWFNGIDGGKQWALLGAGVLFGLAVLSKNIYLLSFAALLGTTVVRSIHTILKTGSARMRWNLVSPFFTTVLGASFPILFWFGYQLSVLQWNGFLSSLQQQFLFAKRHVVGIADILRTLENLWTSRFPILAAMGGIAGIRDLFRIRDISLFYKRFFIMLFVFVWLLWFTFGSIGELRYLLPALSFVSILSAHLLALLSTACGRALGVSPLVRKAPLSNRHLEISCSVVLVGLLLLINNTLAQIKEILFLPAGSHTPHRFAELVETVVPAEARVESRELDIQFLTGRKFYRYSTMNPLNEWIIVGPWSERARVYDPEELQRHYSLEATMRKYALWHVDSKPGLTIERNLLDDLNFSFESGDIRDARASGWTLYCWEGQATAATSEEFSTHGQKSIHLKALTSPLDCSFYSSEVPLPGAGNGHVAQLTADIEVAHGKAGIDIQFLDETGARLKRVRTGPATGQVEIGSWIPDDARYVRAHLRVWGDAPDAYFDNVQLVTSMK